MKTHLIVFAVFNLLLLFSCAKEDPNTELGGDTNIPLTQVDSVSGIYLNYNGNYMGSTQMKVISNIKGDVTYNCKFDLNSLPNDLKTKALDLIPKINQYYNITSLKIASDQKLEFDFKLKITSEGYLDYFTEGKPWVMVKYDDGVGTKYSIKNNKGETLTRTITEKTGIDEWPIGFLLIKTTLIEHQAASDNPIFEKVSYRVNHRFGLVNVEYTLKDGSKFKINIAAFFV